VPRITPRGAVPGGVLAGLLALTVIAVSAAGIAVRDAASASWQHAIALSRELATESLTAGSASPLTARRLAVAAWRIFPTDQAGAVLAGLLMEQQQEGILPGDPANLGVNAVTFSPDGTLLAAAYADGYVRLWNLATGQAVGVPLPAAPARAGACPAWPSARTASSWPAPTPTAPYGCGRCRFSPQMLLFADPYAALCADVGPPTKADWARYAPGEPQPSACR
jgi:WD domain, G-beta repeat